MSSTYAVQVVSSEMLTTSFGHCTIAADGRRSIASEMAADALTAWERSPE